MLPKSSIETKLDQEILLALDKLDGLDPKSEEYGAIIDRVAKLHKLKTEGRPQPVNLNTVLIVGANIFGILWLTRFERENVITAKSALRFVMKP
jgi:hypothetical protein